MPTCTVSGLGHKDGHCGVQPCSYSEDISIMQAMIQAHMDITAHNCSMVLIWPVTAHMLDML